MAQNNMKLEGCIVSNKNNTVFARSGRYMQQVFPWAH